MFYKTIKENFSWIDLILTMSGGLVWLFQPDQIFLPLFLMTLPKAFLFAFGKFKIIPWPYLVLPLVFLVFSAISVINSYKPESSWSIFFWTVGAVLVFFSLASQPKKHFSVLIRMLVFFGTFLAFLMFFSNDLSQVNAPAQILQSFNQKWMQIRPFSLNFYQDSDFISGYFALTFPLGLAVLIRDIRKKEKFFSIITTASLGGNLFGLLVLAEYDAWLGFIGGFFFLFLIFAYDLLRKKTGPTGSILILIFGFCLITSIIFFIPVAGNKNLFFWSLNKAGFYERYEIAANTIQLLRDYPFLGAGWDSFSGIYSKYMLLIPYHYTAQSHNLFLNLALELGPTGFIPLIIIFLLSLFKIIRSQLLDLSQGKQDFLKSALVWSWGTLFLHWLTEDPLYGSIYLLGLFLIPGLSVLYLRSQKQKIRPPLGERKKSFQKVSLPLFTGILVVILVISFAQPLLSAWYANLGIIKLAKLELKGWPDNTSPLNESPDSSQVYFLFENSLFHNPKNVTTNYHFGILNLDIQNFVLANSQLKLSSDKAPKHRGIIKALGFSYAWIGEVDKAAEILGEIPEASYELSVYSWWWKTQGRDDLSEYATQIESILNKNP